MTKDEYIYFVNNYVHFELIQICNLVSNQDYQRALSRSHIKKTVKNFDVHQVKPVKVSRRDGLNYVFDGQHTVESVAEATGSRETPVWCMVYDDMEYLKEADIFANQQKFVRPLSSIDIFNANVEAQNNEQLNIKALVESYGLKIHPGKKDCVITAVGALEYIYYNYGFHVLDRTIRLCVMTWEGESASLSGSMLKGIAILIVVYGDKIKDELFKDKVGACTPKEIARIAKDRIPGAKGYAESMFLAYVKKMKYNNLRMGDILDVNRIAKKKKPIEDQLALEKIKSLQEQQAEQMNLIPDDTQQEEHIEFNDSEKRIF